MPEIMGSVGPLRPIGLKPGPRPTDDPIGMPMTLTLLIISVAIGFELALGICTGAILRNVARTTGGEESVTPRCRQDSQL